MLYDVGLSLSCRINLETWLRQSSLYCVNSSVINNDTLPAVELPASIDFSYGTIIILLMMYRSRIQSQREKM